MSVVNWLTGKVSFGILDMKRLCYIKHLCYVWLQEYDELANKIHEYQMREQRLMEKMSIGRGSPPSSPVPGEETAMSPGPPLTPNNSGSLNPLGGASHLSPLLKIRSPGGHVKAFLPNSMVTTVRTGSLVWVDQMCDWCFCLWVSSSVHVTMW